MDSEKTEQESWIWQKPRFRFPIFWKIILGFGGVILFMGVSSLAFFTIINSGFLAAESDIKTLSQRVQAIESLSQLVVSEREIARQYVVSRDTARIGSFREMGKDFTVGFDSLASSLPLEAFRQELEAASISHSSFIHIMENVFADPIKSRGAQDVTDLVNASRVSDSVIVCLQQIKEKHLLLLNKQVSKAGTNRLAAKELATGLLVLSLVIASGSVYFIGRALVRPVLALMAGTEKVGEGKYATVAVSSRDEIADLTQAFNLMSTKLKQLEEMRMQMMSEISHEMRTPLQVIKAGCHAIVHAKGGPQLSQRQIDAVGMIHGATNRINSFVNLFLDVAKMESGLMKFRFEPVDLLELMTPLVSEMQLIAQSRQIKLEFDALDIGVIHLDKERFTQALTNLLSNALKYTPNDGTITVRMTKATGAIPSSGNAESVRIDVRDTGVGIPESDLGKLFNKFYQAKNTPFVKEKGSGLGLALVKHVAEAHGGSVSVTSTLNVGSTFSIVLPLSES